MKTSHLSRYKDIGALLVKHRSLLTSPGEDDQEISADAEALAADLERLGPTFVKLGQLLSTRSDLLPPAYLRALRRLQSDVAPFSFDEVEQIVSSELGVRLSKAFVTFEEQPIASASLGQVHRAELRGGKRLAVKVQRPNIREQVLDDMDAIETIASFADNHTEAGRRLGFGDMAEEFRRSLIRELDYLNEAKNLEELHANLARWPNLVVPRPVPDLTTRVVLTMDYVSGHPLGKLGRVALVDIDGRELARELFGAYVDQIVVDGFFHADPHPGNVLLTEDGRLALIDVGMTARIAGGVQDQLLKLLLHLSERRGEEAANVAIDLGQELEDFDPEAFRRRASELITSTHSTAMQDMQAGTLISELIRVAAECGLRLPSELTLLGKMLLNLDEVVRMLDPEFDPSAAIADETRDVTRQKLLQSVSPANVLTAAIEAKEFAEHLPRQLHDVMETLSSGELTLNIRGIDEREIMRSVQKLANRVTTGLIVAALVIGAGLIMRIHTETKLFGYPALAIVLFLFAAVIAVSVIVSILVNDLPQRNRRRGSAPHG
jgi:ubiquinone biosynthesis protein